MKTLRPTSTALLPCILLACSPGAEPSKTETARTGTDTVYHETVVGVAASGITSIHSSTAIDAKALLFAEPREKPRPAAARHPAPRDFGKEVTQAALQALKERSEADQIDVLVAIATTGSPLTPSISGESIESAQRGMVASSQLAFEEQLGTKATVTKRYWLVNAVIVRTTVAFAREIAQWPSVRAIEVNRGPLKSTAAYDGNSLANGTKLGAFAPYGFDGRSGHPGGGRVRLGIIEHRPLGYPTGCGFSDPGVDLAGNHYSFNNADGTTRIRSKKECSFDYYPTIGCTSMPLASQSNGCGPSHATAVAWVAAGNIQDGQDPANPPSGILGPYITGARSGVAKHSDIYFYNIASCWDLTEALQAAVADGTDVINMSFQYDSSGYGHAGPISGPLCPSAMTGGCFVAQQALAAARQSGVGLVAASGNNQLYNGNTCTQLFPALDYNVLTVGNLDSQDSNYAYSSLTLRASSSFGGVQATSISGVTTSLSGVTLAAPGTYNLNAAQAPGSYNGGGYVTGTSFAAPVVTGAFANIKNALSSYGLTSDNNTLFAYMMTLGDGYEPLGEAYRQTNASGTIQTGLSRATGAGRFYAHHPGDMVGQSGWGTRAFVMNGATPIVSWWVGGSATGRLPATVTQWRMAAFWYDVDYFGNPNPQIADIDFTVTNECVGCAYPGAPGCLYHERVAEQIDYDTHNRIALTGANVANRCLLVTAQLYTTSASRTVYAVDWFDSSSAPLQ